MANPYAPGPLFEGGKSLVGALMGGDDVYEAARQKEQLRGLNLRGLEASTESKIEKAIMDRNMRVAQDGYEGTFRTLLPNVDPIAAAQLARAGGGNFNVLAQGVAQMGKNEALGRIEGLAAAEGMNPLNAAVMRVAPKLVETIDTQGGQNIRGQYGNAPVIENTDATEAAMRRQDMTATGTRQVADARVHRIYNPVWNPNTGKGGAAPKPPQYKLPSASAITAALGVPDAKDPAKAVVPPGKKADFIDWQRRNAEVDPAFNNGTFALARYVANKPAIRPEQYEFLPGAGYTSVPADQDPEAIGELAGVIADRRRQGLPPLTATQRLEAITNRRKTGSMNILENVATAAARRPPPGPKGNTPSPITVTKPAAKAPAAAIQRLRANPQLAPDFIEMYGQDTFDSVIADWRR